MPVFQDFSGRAAGRASLRLRGLAVAAVVAVAAVTLTAYSDGKFSDRFTVWIDASTVGEGLAPGAEVKLYGFAIGKVTQIDTLGFGHQQLELSLDRSQAEHLTDDVTAQYTSSNVFGSTAIELVNRGGGAPLADGATLHIGENSANATITSVFRKAGQLTRVLDTDEVDQLFDLLITNTETLGPTVRAFFETAKLLADNKRAPVAEYLRIGGEVSAGATELTPPVVDLIARLLDTSAYFGETANQDRTNKAISGLADQALTPLAVILCDNQTDISTIVDTVLDLVIPLAASIGTVAPTYHRLPQLLERIGAAFPVVDDRVQLQLELISKDLPYLVNSIVGVAK
ncbi:MlaD family protein [Antrihabitans spumae]|uniref:MlaD family protein n=1 Tax=Antrihabitans spumae TaxID=3373370 RepID=A0ABW7KLD1_9NOCA